VNAPLSIPQTVAVLRTRYPDALVCVKCGVLLATAAASYSKSNLAEAARLAYMCAECRQATAEAAAAAESRRATGIANLVAARAARRVTQAALREPVLAPVESSTSTAVDMTVQFGGRPRKHASLKEAARAASRAYRARLKASELVPA
jgi:hypothetical protein